MHEALVRAGVASQFVTINGSAHGFLGKAAERANAKVGILESAVAWANGNALERESSAGDSRALPDALNRSDNEMNLTRSIELEAVAALPPDAVGPEARFPALMKGVIVRIRGIRDGSPNHADTVRCREEVWRMAGWVRCSWASRLPDARWR